MTYPILQPMIALVLWSLLMLLWLLAVRIPALLNSCSSLTVC